MSDLTSKVKQQLDILNGMSADFLRLKMGELTANEVRVAKAAIRLACDIIHQTVDDKHE